MRSSYLRPGQFEIVAHRGGSLESPENTIEAFTHAQKVYASSIFELDVHLSKDGEVVVMHDETVDRTTDGHGKISALTLKELKKLKVGGRTQIPTLKEVFQAFPKNRICVEIKYPGFEEKVAALITKFGAEERVCLASEDHVVLKRIRKLKPTMCSGYSGREVLFTLIANSLRIPWAPPPGRVYQVPIRHHNIPVVDEDFIKRAHARGKLVHVWTVNDEPTMRRLIEAGADGLITDAPSLLLSVARELKKI